MASRLWKFLTAEARELFSAETVTEGTEAASAVLTLAQTLQAQGPKVKQIAPLVKKISTLLDVLNSPLAEIVGAGLPFVSIAAKLLGFYLEKTQGQPSLEQCVALVCQSAYLESLRELLKNSPDLLNAIGEKTASPTVQQQLKELSELELDEEEAKKAVVCFGESFLATAFGEVLSARLEDGGLTTVQAQRLTARVAWNTHRYMMEAWALFGEANEYLAPPSFGEWRKELGKYQSIDNYLAEQIAPLPLGKLFGEIFTFRDIYVPLRAKLIDKNGLVDEESLAFDLESWVTLILEQQQDQVMFIQAGPGRGKSVFCRMFADWVRQHLYPLWIPVLIRLRDIPKLQPSFQETLREAVSAGFASNEGWLTDRNTRYLFLLDGFDELLMEGRTSGGLEQFLRQAGQFQRDSHLGRDMGHRMLITGRTLALQGIERQIPDNFQRVRIEVMDEQLQQQWLGKWSLQVGEEKASAFEQFLQDDRCPDRVRQLAREPLLLNLLAAMHRDGKLRVSDFEKASSTKAKILIYQQSLDWVLTKQRPEWLTRELTEQGDPQLRRILSEAGLCVMQSGGESASVRAIESRLKGDHEAKELLEEAQKRIGDNPLRNALAAFYIQPGSKEGSVEFAHKSFGEFLCAQRLKDSIIEWTEAGSKHRKFHLPEELLHWEIYDLLGYGTLTPEIVEYLMALLTVSLEFRPLELCDRLTDFYHRWSDGEFIDLAEETLAQKKTRQLQKLGLGLGQRQVDVYAGLNVMILLLELHRYGHKKDELKESMTFYPCGKPNSEGQLDDPIRLFRLIGYSNCISAVSFLNAVGQFLSGANLNGADLRGTNLSGANLKGANLCNANLSGADLRGAVLGDVLLKSAFASDVNLRGADLNRAILTGADLRNADLRGADLNSAVLRSAVLRGANLSGAVLRGVILKGTYLNNADLSGVDLSGADFSGADLRGADLSGAIMGSRAFGEIRWNRNSKWEDVRGLDKALNVPLALKQHLGL